MKKEINTYVYIKDTTGAKKGDEIKTSNIVAKALVLKGILELKKEVKKSFKSKKQD